MLGENVKRRTIPSDVVEIDVREDEEQAVKFNEIVDLLVAAGYFRARIKGLSNFDKVVGGMTWCIESCNFDVDVDLLFHENLTIGQKISLTEKIVVVLPKMNCPHRIEPHQIQGLDCIHIFPVIQWLVKRSMETRAETADSVREFALLQFSKSHNFTSLQDVTAAETLAPSVLAARRVYGPRRRFKKGDVASKDDTTRIKSTLLEYGNLPHALDTPSDSVDDSPSAASPLTEKTHAQLDEERLSASAVGNIVSLQAQEIVQAAERYANLSSAIGSISEDSRLSSALEKQRQHLQSRLKRLKDERETAEKSVSAAVKEAEEIRERKHAVEEDLARLREAETGENRATWLRLEELLAVHLGLKDQGQKFREQCKADAVQLQRLVDNMAGCEPQEEESRAAEYDALKESIHKTRLILAKKNRAIASLIRQLDDVPGRSELTQYQRRFMELYNQVSAKHKETKQYYTLYNTLDDTKLYLSKELSLLNSIQDNYNEAMASASGKDQFLKQFEAIITGVKRNKEKVEKKCADEKERKYSLNKQLATLVEQQRKYVAAVRQLTIECRKNEALLAQLRAT